jgi:hypothetical protein
MSFELNGRQGDFYTVLPCEYSEIFREVYRKIYREIVVRFEIPDREIHTLITFVLHNFVASGLALPFVRASYFLIYKKPFPC